MKNKKWILFFVSLALIAGSAVLLAQLRSHPHLGRPGIKAQAIPGDIKMKIDLPEFVLDFTSTNVPEPEVVLGYLPPDSSFAERLYTAPDGFQTQATIVLMGADRTSIHNADYCLEGTGFSGRQKSIVKIPFAGSSEPLRASRWNLSGVFSEPNGEKVERHGVYVFWFVADGDETPDHFEMMEKMAGHLLHTGELQRWAYVSYFTPCAAGQEDATFERMEKLISESVPKFQLPMPSATAIAPR